MAATSSKRLQKQVAFYVIAGLLSLVALVALAFRTVLQSPKGAISKVLASVGMDEQTIKFWIAISAFETNGWTSRVFKDSNNLFNIIVPGSVKLSYGEGQTIYSGIEESVRGLYDHVLKPYRYPLSFRKLADLVAFMKSKNYFESNEDAYLSGCKQWYKKLFNVDAP